MNPTIVLRLLALVLFATCWWLLAPTSLGGQNTYVVTDGVSMQPGLTEGDLVIARRPDDYEVGDVALYRSAILGVPVLHRIVEESADGFTLRGDNNSWLDPDRPQLSDMQGKQVATIPQFGTWLGRFWKPTALGVLTLSLLSVSGTTAHRRRRKKRTMSQAPRRAPRPATGDHRPRLAAALAVSAAVAVTAAAAGYLISGDGTATSTGVDGAPSLTLSYMADVPRSPAYDSTTVTSPQPLFRKLSDTVDVHYAYQGPAGTLDLEATLSSSSGWESTIPLQGPSEVTGPDASGSVPLDLDALDRRADRAARVIGIPTTELEVVVQAQVTGDDTETSAELPMTLTAERMVSGAPASEPAVGASPKSLGTPGTPESGGSVTSRLRQALADHPVPAALLLLGALLLAGAWRTGSGTSSPGDHRAKQRRYGSLIIDVDPILHPPGRPVIDVPDFAALVKLAERYGLLLMHWSRSGIDTYVVQDEGTTYRFRPTDPSAETRQEAQDPEAVRPVTP